MLTLDHIAIGCTELASGVVWAERQLGVALVPGGKHARYGTHNMLLRLADGLYLEVIAKDSDATDTPGPCWFGLDSFDGAPRLANWICKSDDLVSDLAAAPDAVGKAVDLERDGLRWQITVPDDGSLPYEGGYPTLIQWAEGVQHPATKLPDSGCRLMEWCVIHPEAELLRTSIPLRDTRVRFETGAVPAFRATIQTPNGQKILV